MAFGQVKTVSSKTKEVKMNKRNIDYYLNLPYTIQVYRDSSEENPGWVASVAELSGCITQADTFEELGEMINDAMYSWIEAALEDGIEIPEPRLEEDYSGKFVVRVPTSLHRSLTITSEREGVSLNSYINVALASYVSGGGSHPSPTAAPKRVFPGLSNDALRVLTSQGLQEEANKADESMFGQWLQQKVTELEKAHSSSESEECLYLIDNILKSVSDDASESPVMSAIIQLVKFQQHLLYSHYQNEQKMRATADMLHEQIERAIGRVNTPQNKIANEDSIKYADATTKFESSLADNFFKSYVEKGSGSNK